MKTYRGNMQSVDPQDALPSLDAFCRKYEAFLCDLLKVTSRPTSKMLCDATAQPDVRRARVQGCASPKQQGGGCKNCE